MGKKSKCLKANDNQQQCDYKDSPLCQNMELFTQTLWQIDKKSKRNHFEQVLEGVKLAKIDKNLKGLEEAIKGEKIQKEREKKRTSLLSSILPQIKKLF